MFAFHSGFSTDNDLLFLSETLRDQSGGNNVNVAFLELSFDSPSQYLHKTDICEQSITLIHLFVRKKQDTRLPPGYFAPSNFVKDAF